MDFRSDRILLTGSGGFTGRPLRARLEEDGHEIIGLTRTQGETNEIPGDLCDRDWARRVIADIRPTVVVHLAGITTPLHADVGEIYSVNVVATENLLAALSELTSRPQQVIVASSATVYAPPSGRPIAEEHPLEPQNHYGVSKRAMEDVVRFYNDRLPTIVARPFNYTGPGQDPIFLTPKIVDHFVRRAPQIKLGNLDLFRDISDIRRVVEVYARLIAQRVQPTTINICSGRSINLSSIILIMQELSGHLIEVVRDPGLIRPNETRSITGSTVHLDATLGDLPNPEIRETLSAMYESRCSEVTGRGDVVSHRTPGE